MNVYLEYLEPDSVSKEKQSKIHKICPKTFQIMAFLYNSLEDGWSIKKNGSTFIFSKKHEGKKEVMEESFLNTFVESNLNLEKILYYK